MLAPKLVSHWFMRMLNTHLELAGRKPISKRGFMVMLGILSRRQQAMLVHQFDTLKKGASRADRLG